MVFDKKEYMKIINIEHKKHLLFLGIGSFCLFVFSFTMGIFNFIQGKFILGIFWTLLVMINFLSTCSVIKEHKEK